MTTSPVVLLIISLGRRDWKSYVLAHVWLLPLWYGLALGVVHLPEALRFSWLAQPLLTVYVYRSIARSHLLALLPITRREAWTAAAVLATVVPALLQIFLGLLMLAVAPDAGRGPFHAAPGWDTVILGGLYTTMFLQLALCIAVWVAPGGRRLRQAFAFAAMVGLFAYADRLPVSIDTFTPGSAMLLWIAGALVIVTWRRPPEFVARPSLRRDSARPVWPSVTFGRLADRLTGFPRIVVAHLTVGTIMFGPGFLLVLWLSRFIEGQTMAEAAADLLAPFGSTGDWVMQPAGSVLFTPIWVLSFTNVWHPLMRQLRVLPLTAPQVTAAFLALPIAMWMLVWLMLAGMYWSLVGAPVSLRFDVLVAGAGTVAMATACGLRWQNRLFGMVGPALTYAFWFAGSIAALVLNVRASGWLVTTTGLVLLLAAAGVQLHTIRHANSASAAYQRPPKFFDTPARS